MVEESAECRVQNEELERLVNFIAALAGGSPRRREATAMTSLQMKLILRPGLSRSGKGIGTGDRFSDCTGDVYALS
jgi:hypothetical protein